MSNNYDVFEILKGNLNLMFIIFGAFDNITGNRYYIILPPLIYISMYLHGELMWRDLLDYFWKYIHTVHDYNKFIPQENWFLLAAILDISLRMRT